MDQELFAQIAELLGVEASELEGVTLDELEERLITLFNTEAEAEDTPLERLEALAVAREGVAAAIADADTAEASRLADVEALRQRMVPAAETTPAEGDEGEGDDGEEDGAGEGDEATEAEAGAVVEEAEEVVRTAEPEPVSAAGEPAPPAPRVVLPRRRPQSHAPVPTIEEEGNVVTITAAGDVPGFSAGQRMPTLGDVGRSLAEKLYAIGSTKGITGKVPVARMHLNYPEDRMLEPQNEGQNSQRIQAVVSAAALQRAGEEARALGAVTAAGGLCAPVGVRYDLMTVGSDERPVRDALARFDAGRGGINFITPPTLANITSGVAVVTETQDAADVTKDCLTITCGTPTEVDVSAVYQCVQIGEFNRRFFPEQFEGWWGLAATAHARTAEGQLLDGIGAASTQASDGQNLGAARDFIEASIRSAAGRRSFHRMSRSAPIRQLSPAWVLDMIKADLIREQPGAPVDMVRTDAQINAMFAAANLNITWYLDTETGEGQIFPNQGNAALNGWPLTVVSYQFPEGSFLFLDGGVLDLGIEIRDTTMISQNNSRAFLETFENVAFVGPWSSEITHNLCVSGASSLPIAVTCPENS